MSNRVTIAQAVQMPVTEVANLPTDILQLLLEGVADLKSNAKRLDDHIYNAVKLRFSEQVQEARKAKGVGTGTVRIDDGDYVIVSDLPKKVSWDTDGLRQVAQHLKDIGEPVSDYIQIRMDVSERAYLSWPQSLKKTFDPYRTVGTGRENFKIEKKDAA